MVGREVVKRNGVPDVVIRSGSLPVRRPANAVVEVDHVGTHSVVVLAAVVFVVVAVVVVAFAVVVGIDIVDVVVITSKFGLHGSGEERCRPSDVDISGNFVKFSNGVG